MRRSGLVIQGSGWEERMGVERFWLTDEQFARIAPHLPTPLGRGMWGLGNDTLHLQPR
jgi:hypothetical protein